MKHTCLAGALATVALLVSGCSLTTHHTAARRPHGPRSGRRSRPRPGQPRPLAHQPRRPGPGHLNEDVDRLASALVIENQATTVANHLAFEAAARTVATEARSILADPALLPTEHRAAYVSMLYDFITVANILQPGAHYGTTAQDYTAWYTALRASNITVA